MLTGAVLGLSVMSLATASRANLVINGDFETNGGVGQIGGGVSSLANWTSGTPDGGGTAFNFVVDRNADSTGFPSVNTPQAGVNIKLWGPNSGANNGFTGSPNGGFFAGLAGAFMTAALSQTVSGLTPGQQYVLSFTWAGSQFTDVTGANSQYLQAGFGGETWNTETVNLPSQDFAAWRDATHTFTATSASQTLSFLAFGSPSGTAPFTLLDSVSLVEQSGGGGGGGGGGNVPEPASATLVLLGTALAYPFRRTSRRRTTRRVAKG